ncbi:MAG: RNA polymerase sigma factor [Bacteroidota bacterium]
MPYSDKSDEKLLELYRDTRDKGIVFALFERYRDVFIALVLKMTRSQADTEDVLSGVVIDLFDDLLKFKVRNFFAFTYTKTRRKTLTFLQKRGRTEVVDMFDEKFPEHPVEKPDLSRLDNEQKEKAQKILADCFESLNEIQKKTLHLFYYYRDEKGKYGMRYKKIEKRANLTERQVKTGIETGRRKLKKCLEKNGIRGLDDYYNPD